MRFLFFAGFCAGLFGFGQGPLKQRLDADLETYIDVFQPAGLTASVVVDGKLVYTRAFGFKNIDTREPMTTNAIFHAASVSKPFAATAIMHLVERGKLSLDEPIITYLPYFKLDGESYKKITLREILTHRSGMPDVEDYEWDKPQLDVGAAERYVRSIAEEKPIGPRGAQYAYSNMAFDVLADVVHKVSGQPFEDYLKQHILNPIGMKHSTFLKPDVPKNLATSPHITENMVMKASAIYPYNRRHAPSSTLNTNVLELARWGIANLNRGSIDGKRILMPESYQELFKPQAAGNGNSKVGLSWFIYDFRGHQMIAHSGGDLGYRSQFALIPEKGIAVALLCNADHVATAQIRDSMLLAALNLPHETIKKPIRFVIQRVYQKQGLKAAIKHYQTLKSSASDRHDFSIGQLYRLGYDLIEANQLQDALAFFKLNVEAYPDHTGAQGALGEAYLKTGDRTKAIEHLRKAIAIDPENHMRRTMLEEVLAQK